jgi:anti-anti-sigma factor
MSLGDVKLESVEAWQAGSLPHAGVSKCLNRDDEQCRIQWETLTMIEIRQHKTYAEPGLYTARFDPTGGRLLVRLPNRELSGKFVSRLNKALDKTIAECRPEVLTFDLTDLDFVSSETLNLFLRHRHKQGAVHLANPSNHLRDLLQRTNLDRLFPVYSKAK